MLLFRKFYNDSPDNGGASAPAVLPPEVEKELTRLKEFERTMLSTQNKTPEDIEREAEVERVNMRQYSVSNKLMKDEDFTKLDTIKGKSDQDLVFEDFSAEWKADNPEGTHEELQEAFNSQYHINSENKTLKTRGEKLMKQEAASLRQPLESSFKTAKERYNEDKMMRGEVPGFNKFVDEVIAENTPETVVIKTKDGDQEVDIDVALTQEQKDEISKTFKNEKAFVKYLDKDKRAELKAAISKKIQGFIKVNNFDRAVQRGFEIGKGRGTAAGSGVGAEQPYGIVRNIATNNNVPNKAVLDEINESFNAVRAAMGK